MSAHCEPSQDLLYHYHSNNYCTCTRNDQYTERLLFTGDVMGLVASALVNFNRRAHEADFPKDNAEIDVIGE